ncbi:MAG TPA: hypothetical protein VIN03_11940 [Roseateles sp.]
MSHHQDIVQGGGGAAVFGWAVTAWTWFSGGVSPLAALATLLTVVLTGLKLYDAIQRKRKGKPLDSSAMPLGDR